jgi:hypothetical protein
LAPLRWLFLLISLFSAARCLWGFTPGRAAAAAAFGGLWYLLSRWKMHALDRANLGLAWRGKTESR